MSGSPNDVAAQLRALQRMGAPELRSLWQKTFGRPHLGWVQRSFLSQALAYHLQEKAYGGLSAALRRRLAAYAEEVQAKGSIASLTRHRIKPGTRLVREWQGETHVVTTLDAEFEYRGERYKSLSEIARAITRTRWSGPAFFGLKRGSAGPARRASTSHDD
jgi:hypothetical protein